MNNKLFYIEVDEQSKIVRFIETYEQMDELIELSEDEYHKGQDFLKFNPQTREFIDPIKPLPEAVNLHEELTIAINDHVEVSSADNMINMDMILELDQKMNLILEHLGIDH